MGVAALIAAIVFFADFLLKTYLRLNFEPAQTFPLIKNVFHITFVFNRGAAFGILQGKTTFLIYIGIIFVCVFLFLMKKEKRKSLLFFIASGLILGGALSNLGDRIFLKGVIDYLDIRIWPVFNLSDTCITIGAGLLIWESFVKK